MMDGHVLRIFLEMRSQRYLVEILLLRTDPAYYLLVGDARGKHHGGYHSKGMHLRKDLVAC